LAGYTGCGKTTARNYLCRNYGSIFKKISTGDISRQHLKKRGLAETHENLQKITKDLVSIHGDAYITLAFPEKLEPGKIFVIDAIRRPTDIQYIEKLFGECLLLYFSCQDNIRFNRLIGRNRVGDVKNYEEFENMTLIENTWGAQTLQSLANVNVVNDSSIEELFNKLDEIVNELSQF
jgi:dephospho-CoA kinase